MEKGNWKAWLLAARPKTLTASVSPVLVGSALAYHDGSFRWVPAVLCFFVALWAQVAANLANDYFDFRKGADTGERLGPSRAVASGWIAPGAMWRAALGVLALACLCGCGLLFYGGWQLIWVGLAVAVCAIAYSAGPYPLAYNGWGDVCVLLFYGIVPVCFTYYTQTNAFSPTAFWLSMSMGLLSVNILLVNNCRDCAQDRAAGKRTTVVLFGRRFGHVLYLTNILLAVAFSWPVYLFRGWNCRLLFLFFLILQLFTWQDLLRLQGRELNRTLEQTARNVLLYALLLISMLI
ncbi:MAG: 1,4-dihydroxy-2-naphthoate polyprenyltransferase [Tannerella sp.]|jgi:1,4-dihydroxy-2-naphthoate octaprenyltransferase|nr:1,4-dihydroxy-2-naphthoate polyprenyltransferase [Tannerella sp.]